MSPSLPGAVARFAGPAASCAGVHVCVCVCVCARAHARACVYRHVGGGVSAAFLAVVLQGAGIQTTESVLEKPPHSCSLAAPLLHATRCACCAALGVLRHAALHCASASCCGCCATSHVSRLAVAASYSSMECGMHVCTHGCACMCT